MCFNELQLDSPILLQLCHILQTTGCWGCKLFNMCKSDGLKSVNCLLHERQYNQLCIEFSISWLWQTPESLQTFASLFPHHHCYASLRNQREPFSDMTGWTHRSLGCQWSWLSNWQNVADLEKCSTSSQSIHQSLFPFQRHLNQAHSGLIDGASFKQQPTNNRVISFEKY